MSKAYGDHGIQLVATETENQWSIIIRCDDCRKHIKIDNVDFAEKDAMLFIEAEMQMHAVGTSDGWHDGIGFAVEDS